jgi:hypothetical protein
MFCLDSSFWRSVECYVRACGIVEIRRFTLHIVQSAHLPKCGWNLSELWMKSSRVWMRSIWVWMRSSQVWMRCSQVVKATDCQCQSRNNPGFKPSIFQPSGIWGAAGKRNCWINYYKKIQKITPLKLYKGRSAIGAVIAKEQFSDPLYLWNCTYRWLPVEASVPDL